MKRMFLSLGLSVTILLSAAFAQETMQRATAPVQKSTVELTSKKQLPSFLEKKLAKKRFSPNTTRSSKMSLQPIACYKSEANPDKAVVKIVVSLDWGDGTGYQVLLDSKAKFYDYLNAYEQIEPDSVDHFYTAEIIKIPSNAKPELEGSVILFGNSDSAVIDPGVYDMVVTNPSLTNAGDLRIYVANEGAFDDFEFEKGITYVFNVIDGGSGDYVTLAPDCNLELSSVDVPISYCGATEAPITIEIRNHGTTSAKDFEVFYVPVSLDGEFFGDTVKETCTREVAFNQSTEFTFATRLEFTKDTVYGIIAGITPLEDEDDEDNVSEALVIRKSAVTVPHSFNIENFDITFGLDGWEFSEDDLGNTVLASQRELYPAITRCITMDAGTYRISYDRVLGFSFWGMEIPASYSVLFGKANTDISTWRTIHSEKETIYEDFKAHTISTEVTEAGEYAFVFIEDTSEYGGGLVLRNINVSEVLNNDVKLDAFYVNMPHMFPLEHASGTFKASATIVNYGKNNIDKVTLQVKAGEKVLFSKEEITLGGANAAKTETFDLDIDFTALGTYELTAIVSYASDDDLSNNELTQEVIVTDDVMAYDYVTEDMYNNDYAFGSRYGGVGLGLPFSISKQDTLTGVSVGWSEMDEDMDIEISIYRWNAEEETLGDMLYRDFQKRGTSAEQRIYKIPALLLGSGDYMISVHQTTAWFGLVCDLNPNGIIYSSSDNEIMPSTDLGYPSIRAIFGHDGKPLAKDLAVLEISKPKEIGVFSNEEPIVVKVKNNGFTPVETPLTVTVNDKSLPAQTVKLAAYAEKEYTFKGDLSAADTKFVIKATVNLEGDENTENNSQERTVHSMPPIDPYVMDFEYCDDFAIDNELAAWIGVCGPSKNDADGTFGFQSITFPHSNELFAFTAYNAASTTPASSGYIEAHGGERFGASFAWRYTDMENSRYVGVPNDAWLISPQLKLANENANIKFFVKTYDGEIGLEEYNVLISTTDNKLESFEKLGETRKAPAEDWTEVTVDLADYNGKTAYLAIQCVSDDQFIFMIDDIVVAGNVANDNSVASIRLNAWPNPAKEMVYLSADQAIEQVSIYSPAGYMLYQSADNMNAEEFRYSVKNLNAGLYIARVKTAQGTGVVKFVVR